MGELTIPARDPRLLIRATDDLLAGWCGPIVARHVPCVLLLGRIENMPDHVLTSGWTDSVPIDEICLDLSRAEVRDRVARVVARSQPNYQGGALAWAFSGALGGWMMEERLPLLHIDDRREQGWAFCSGPYFESWGRFDALANVNPNDPTLLPDGSRLVDALALAAVARQVLGLEPVEVADGE